MTFESKKKFVLEKINNNFFYKKKSLDNDYTIEQYLESIRDNFLMDLSFKIIFLKNKNFAYLNQVSIEEEILRLEEYIDFLLEMHSLVISLGKKNSSDLEFFHRSNFDSRLINNMYL